MQFVLGDPALAGGLDQMIPRVPCQLLPFCGSVILWNTYEYGYKATVIL